MIRPIYTHETNKQLI